MVVATVGAAMGAAGIGNQGGEPCHAVVVLTRGSVPARTAEPVISGRFKIPVKSHKLS
jgi:hypothetical protein